MTTEAPPDPTRHTDMPTTFAIAGTVALLSVVWLAAAIVRPDSTFHLGPMILPFAPLLVSERGIARVRGVVIGIAAGAAILGFLAALDRLSGPALAPFPSAMAESVIVLGISGVVALILARSTR